MWVVYAAGILSNVTCYAKRGQQAEIAKMSLSFHKVGTTLHALLKLDAESSFRYEAVKTSFL